MRYRFFITTSLLRYQKLWYGGTGSGWLKGLILTSLQIGGPGLPGITFSFCAEMLGFSGRRSKLRSSIMSTALFG